MRRDEISELHYITPIKNVPSMLARGLLSHNGAQHVPHTSVAMEEVQDRRRNVVLPTGRRLHDHVNLYFNARNAMMYKLKLKDLHATLCVLRISTNVLDVPGVVVTDRNAASTPVFGAPSAGLARLDRNLVFANSWYYPDDPVATADHRAIMCAEVLVPDCVPPEFIQGAYVSCAQSRADLAPVAGNLSVIESPNLFFRG